MSRSSRLTPTNPVSPIFSSAHALHNLPRCRASRNILIHSPLHSPVCSRAERKDINRPLAAAGVVSVKPSC
ncbi:hypothetical protein E2C01_025441 [Portunus trituberculatus]|uniref:Uncharacterized protein n=1 Tax=Portunus trituberculatus TaxID=210409 RepID=A0A5B7EFY2_PORTR|nr:hypothetical protein [Portunus trituberculatus]